MNQYNCKNYLEKKIWHSDDFAKFFHFHTNDFLIFELYLLLFFFVVQNFHCFYLLFAFHLQLLLAIIPQEFFDYRLLVLLILSKAIFLLFFHLYQQYLYLNFLTFLIQNFVTKNRLPSF